MPKVRHKRKLRDRQNMKGGAGEEAVMTTGAALAYGSRPTLTRQKASRNLTGGSSYPSYTDNLYLTFMLALGVVGIIWFILSRSLIRHKFSEVLCYSLFIASIVISLFLILIAGVKRIKTSGGGIMQQIKKMLNIAQFVIYNSLPAVLIIVQLAVLIYIMSKNADWLHTSNNIPWIFTIFNLTSVTMIMIQLFVWRTVVRKIVLSDGKGKLNRMTIPGFVLAFLVSGIAISQLYVILEYLRTDC